MRRIISFIVMVCVLHTQTYCAPHDGVNVSSSSAVQSGAVNQPVDLEAGGDAAEPKPFGMDVMCALKHHATTLKEHVQVLKEQVSEFIKTPLGFSVALFSGVALVLYSIYVCYVGYMAWIDDLPFDVASKHLTHRSLSSYDQLDTCLNFLASGKELKRIQRFAHYAHATTQDGVGLYSAIPQWFNNATNLVSMLGTLVLADRSLGRKGYTNTYEFEKNFIKLLLAYGVSGKPQDSCCAYKLGNGIEADALTMCQKDTSKDIYLTPNIPDADAIIQFRPQVNTREVQSADDVRVRITFKRKMFRDQRYPELDCTPDHRQLDEVARVSMQRRLLQLGNGMPLAAAVKDRVQNHLQIMAQLTAVLSKLRFSETVDASEVTALSSLVKSVFIANQLALTSDVGCDVEFAGGLFNLLECFEGSYANIQAGAPTPEDAQVWFVHNGANVVFDVAAIGNKAPVTEAMAVWLKQSADAMHSLWVVANTLHHRVCNGTADKYLDQFGKAAQNQLRAHNAYLQGDLGCDVRLSDGGVGEIVCHSGTAPVTNSTCELESDIPVRWEGKVWLKPQALNSSLIEGATVSVSHVWQASRSGTRAFSPSVLESPEVSASDSVSGSDSADLSAEVSTSGSGSRTTHTPSLPNANTTQGNGITELYYVDGGNRDVRNAFFNGAHMLNDTLFLANTTFGGTYPAGGLHFDPIGPRIFWTTSNSTNNQYKNIYVAELLSNPTQLNNTRIVYSSTAQVFRLYVANAVGCVFWTDGNIGIYKGNVNVSHPTNITNVTSQSMITQTSNSAIGLYYHPQTQALLWSRPEDSLTRYPIYISTVNFQTNMLTNTSILLNESSYIYSLSYDTKNRRLIFSKLSNGLYIAPFSFENPMPLTNVTEILTTNSVRAISVVND